MEQIERSEPLTPDDVRILQESARFNFGCTVSGLLGLVFVSAYLLLHPSALTIILVIIFALLGLAVLALTTLNTLFDRKAVKKDISEGQKKVITARMESQRMASRERKTSRGAYIATDMTYYMKIGGKEYSTSEETYMKHRPGEFLEVHLGPNSGKLIRITEASGPILPETEKAGQNPPAGPNKS